MCFPPLAGGGAKLCIMRAGVYIDIHTYIYAPIQTHMFCMCIHMYISSNDKHMFKCGCFIYISIYIYMYSLYVVQLETEQTQYTTCTCTYIPQRVPYCGPQGDSSKCYDYGCYTFLRRWSLFITCSGAAG